MKIINYMVLIIMISLTACGFHLRGSQPGSVLSISNLYVIDSDASIVGDEVRTLIQQTGTRISPNNDNAEYTLQLFDQNVNQSVLSVSAVTGKVEEYQLVMTVRMTVIDKDKNERIANQGIRIIRDYAFDDRAVLGSESERRLLTEEMARQAAAQILQRLNSVTR